jgi:hypothetical protein
LRELALNNSTLEFHHSRRLSREQLRLIPYAW